MLPTTFLSATLSPEPRATHGYLGEPVTLATAHASSTSLQLCFAARPSVPRRLGSAPAALGQRWAIVLAGGSGTRLAELTHAAYGHPVPKQYCSLSGGRSLLGDALARADALVGRHRTVVVVASEHERYWQPELRGRAPENVVVQPRNRGTAAGVLLPLSVIAARDPDAQVTLLPSDHFVGDELRLATALRVAQDGAALLPDRVVLVGIEADAPEPGYGWILPDARGNGLLRPVRRFVEKPDPAAAKALMLAGAVWNSFLLVGSARALLRLYAHRVPGLLAAFERVRDIGDRDAVAALYESLPDGDFCRLLLQGSEDRLLLYSAAACGWTDLGTPARVAACTAWLLAHRDASLRPDSLGAAAMLDAAPGAVP